MSREWNAVAYHRVSGPQVSWGQKVLARLELAGDEQAIDAGCGSGRLTAELLERLPRGKVVGIDRSQAMLRAASAHLRPTFGAKVALVQVSLPDLPFQGWADLVFSTATFHWVADHAALFAAIFAALRPGGRLFAQCGGGPNLERALQHAAPLMASAPYATFFAGWEGAWNFATPEATADRLRRAGFVDVATDLEPAPTTLSDAAAYREFVSTVIYHPHLARLPDPALRRRWLDVVVDAAATTDPPFHLDYWRLNLQGRRPVSP